MPKQQLLISEAEVQSAVIEYLRKEGILTKFLHSRITFSKIGKVKKYHFNGYYINEGEYQKLMSTVKQLEITVKK